LPLDRRCDAAVGPADRGRFEAINPKKPASGGKGRGQFARPPHPG
jgi:hypothetical protein